MEKSNLEKLKDFGIIMADQCMPLFYAFGKGFGALTIASTMRPEDSLLSAIMVKAWPTLYLGGSAIIEGARFLSAKNMETIHPDKKYRISGGFLPCEILLLRNYLIDRRNRRKAASVNVEILGYDASGNTNYRDLTTRLPISEERYKEILKER